VLRDADNGCSTRLANAGLGERRPRYFLAITPSNNAHAIVDHDNLDVPSTLLEAVAVPEFLADKSVSQPALSGARKNELLFCAFLSMNCIEALDFGRGSPIP
jgi:glutathione S-transferase